MTLYQIPTSTSNVSYTETVILDGAQYELAMRYNTRMQRWMLSLSTISGQPVVVGIPMLPLRDLVGQYTTLELPPGLLFCANIADISAVPTLASFLVDTTFFYRSTT